MCYRTTQVGGVTVYLWQNHTRTWMKTTHVCGQSLPNIWRSRVTHEYEWCRRTCMRHVAHSTMSCVKIHEWDMSCIWLSHVAHVNGSWHRHEWDMSHIYMSHVAHMNESCRTYIWVMSHIWMSHVAHMNESCRTYESVMSHIWMSHDIDICESFVTHRMRHTSHIWRRHIAHIRSRLFITHMNQSCHTRQATRGIRQRRTYKSYVTHTKEPYITHINESCHVYRQLLEFDKVTHVNHSSPTNERVIHHTYEWVYATHENEWVMSHIRGNWCNSTTSNI